MIPHAIVTGASRGVGLSVTRLLLDRGYRVFAHYRTAPADLQHSRLTWWQADFLVPLDDAAPGVDKLDALVHCAGIASVGRGQSREVAAQHMAVNYLAPVELTQRLLPALRAVRGTVVYLNSGAGRQAAAGWSAYSASKHAARGWCDALRAEEPEIRVTSVFPGRIATDMQRAIRAQEGLPYIPDEYLDPNTVARVVGDVLETPRDASLTDVVVRPALPPLL